MHHDETKKPVTAVPEPDGAGPHDPPVIDLKKYQVVKPDWFKGQGEKREKEAT